MECPLDEKGHCDGPDCAFWLGGECLIDDIDLAGRTDLIRWLNELRRELWTETADAAR